MFSFLVPRFRPQNVFYLPEARIHVSTFFEIQKFFASCADTHFECFSFEKRLPGPI